MKPVRPLSAGSVVALVAPASPPPDPTSVPEVIHFLDDMGYTVKPGASLADRHGYLAGTDEDRARDIMAAFTDGEVEAIFCFRGGYGVLRLLHLLDFKKIARNPKLFLAFSDGTALINPITTSCGFITFHAPTPHQIVRESASLYTVRAMLQAVSGRSRPRVFGEGYQGDTVRTLRGGRASGRLFGGNLTILTSLIGTPWEQRFEGKILFFEEVAESPYRIDRMLTQLLASGALKGVKGIAIGILKNCIDPLAEKLNEYRQTAEDVFRDRLLPLGVPIVTGLPFGHGPDNGTLPVGASVTLDGNRGELFLEETGIE